MPKIVAATHCFTTDYRKATSLRAYVVLCAVFSLGMTLTPMAQASENTDDPFESINRKVFVFNDTLDHYILKPVAQTYKKITPTIINKGITNFFHNLAEPWTATNQVLQGKFKKAGQTTSRFLINTLTSLGVADAAAVSLNLPPTSEDFGQTLAVWGVPQGPYIMLPFLGPSTLADAAGKPLDWYASPTKYMFDSNTNLALFALKKLDYRADFLGFEQGSTEGDKYTLIKSVYLQKRQYDISDGDMTETPSDDSFGDIDEFSNDLSINAPQTSDSNVLAESNTNTQLTTENTTQKVESIDLSGTKNITTATATQIQTLQATSLADTAVLANMDNNSTTANTTTNAF